MDSPNRPKNYIYRGKTVTNNGEQFAKLKPDAIESMLKGANLDKNPAFLAEIQPFFDYRHPQPQYTVENYIDVIDRVCDWLYPDLSREQGREQVGRLIFRGFRKLIFGQVALATLHVIGPARAFKLVHPIFKIIYPASPRSVTMLGPCHYVLACRHTAGTYEDEIGMFKEALEEAGACNVRCEVKVLAPNSWDFIFEWD